jgi:hypothetical protein
MTTVAAIALHHSEATPTSTGADETARLDAPANAAIHNATSPSVGALAPAGTLASSGAQGAGLVAQVPLFGPTTMATLERAPVSPTEPSAVVAAREQALAKATQAALASGVDAAKVSEEPVTDVAASSDESTVKPEDVAPFGHGKMKDPTLYRLKLDAPGEALKGTSSSRGFTVVVPGRKLLESPKGFVKRDERFQRIASSQSSDGAKITWQFKDDAPPFRVRLRKNSVEILISESARSGRTN